MNSTRTRTGPRWATAAGAALALVLLSGCGATSGESASSSAVDPGSRAVDSAPAEPGGPAVTGEKSAGDPAAGASDSTSSGSGSAQAAPALSDARIVRLAAMQVRTKDVTAVAARVRDVAETAKGFVADEKTTNAALDPGFVQSQHSYSESVLTVRVPTAALDRVMTQVAETGTVLSRTQSSEDVSSAYVDVRSRVSSQTASVERVRALLARATNLGQIVQIEGELSRREADLESFQAQLKSIEDRTALSTLTVTLTPPGSALVPAPRHDDGFLAGLRSGWTAMTATLTVLLTIVGAVLPFAVLVGLLGFPAYRWYRRSRGGHSRPVASSPAQPQPAP